MIPVRCFAEHPTFFGGPGHTGLKPILDSGALWTDEAVFRTGITASRT